MKQSPLVFSFSILKLILYEQVQARVKPQGRVRDLSNKRLFFPLNSFACIPLKVKILCVYTSQFLILYITFKNYIKIVHIPFN